MSIGKIFLFRAVLLALLAVCFIFAFAACATADVADDNAAAADAADELTVSNYVDIETYLLDVGGVILSDCSIDLLSMDDNYTMSADMDDNGRVCFEQVPIESDLLLRVRDAQGNLHSCWLQLRSAESSDYSGQEDGVLQWQIAESAGELFFVLQLGDGLSCSYISDDTQVVNNTDNADEQDDATDAAADGGSTEGGAA